MHAEHADKSELNELSGRVMGCAFTVLNALGFLEKVHENALSWEIRAAGLHLRVCVNRLPASEL
jgi:predicted outer membrane lipoprotein